MSQVGTDVIDQAIGWQVRLAEASEQEWRDFAAWLETPAHAASFDRIATDDLLVGMVAKSAPAAVPAPQAIAPARQYPRRLRAWAAGGGGALAAAIVAAFLIPGGNEADAMRYTVATAPGEHRSLTLGDGTGIELNGGTRITLDRSRPRFAALDLGQAVFHVRHDPAHPFEVRTGDAVLRDFGTVFEVTRDAERVDVQVAEGAVMFRPDRERIMLRPGMSLRRQHGRAPVTLGRVPVENVGSWRGGRLTFSEAPLGEVARAIERTSGIRLDVAPAASARRFTGSFRLSGNPQRDVAHVAALADVHYLRQRQRWLITL